MYYTDNSILPENMAPLIITAAPYGPAWLPGDASDIPLTWDEQVQAAVDCYEAGATMLHFHVRNPATGMGSTNFDDYNYLLKRVKEAVPDMIIQVGGSISFAPHTDDAKAKWLDYDTRHMLTELDPKPEYVTVTTGTTLWDIASMFSKEDIKGTHMEDPKVLAAWAGMVVDSTPAFYVEHLKRLRKNGIQPYFVPAACPPVGAHRAADPCRRLHGSAEHGALRLMAAGRLGRNPFDWMHFLQRVPQGSVNTFWTSMRGLISISAMALVLGQHVRVGNEDNLWGADRKRKTTVEQIQGVVRLCKEFGRKLATAAEAREIMKVGTWYDSIDETLQNNGMPPSPSDFNPGFLTWPTDGKIKPAVLGGDSHPIAACMIAPEPVRAAQAKLKIAIT